MNKKVFLSGEWRNLIMANYEIDPIVLQKFLPSKTTLDDWEGKYYISLVGFMFMQTKVKGIKIPFHVNFPEVNLRFYVRYKEDKIWKRGVVFISEIVPKPAIALVANTLFKEKYSALPMQHSIYQDQEGNMHVAYKWKKRKKWNSIAVMADAEAGLLNPNSKEEFITEHFWGYTGIDVNRCGEYEVEHPRWKIHPVNHYTIECDFASLYGQSFAHLSQDNPSSVFLAQGSAIKVYSKRII